MTDEAMSPLRRRMIEDMTIRKLAPKTQQGYIRTIKDLAAFLGRSHADGAGTAGAFREPLRLDIEALLCPLNHRLRCADLRLADGTRRFDIQDDANLHIDQVIVGICEKCWSPHRAGPLRGRIGRRDELRRYLGGSAESRVVEGCHILLHSSACGLRIALLD